MRINGVNPGEVAANLVHVARNTTHTRLKIEACRQLCMSVNIYNANFDGGTYEIITNDLFGMYMDFIT